jgi:hypothetical protein
MTEPLEHLLWSMQAKARSSSHKWQEVSVEAGSAQEAEAIAERRGLDVLVASTKLGQGQGSTIRDMLSSYAGPLQCERCKYVLDGVLVTGSLVECSECGHYQCVIAKPILTPYPDGAHPFVLFLAGIGAIVFVILILIVMSFLIMMLGY